MNEFSNYVDCRWNNIHATFNYVSNWINNYYLQIFRTIPFFLEKMISKIFDYSL